METFYHAVERFLSSLGEIGWAALGIALALHFLRLGVRVLAWRHIIRAAYPGTDVPRRGLFGAYVAGVGVNSITPARGGDLLRLFLAKRRVEGSTYPTLGATLLPETLFDSVLAGSLILWGFAIGALPGLDVLPDLPTIDWSWIPRHPNASIVIAGLALIAIAAAFVLAERRLQSFWERVRQGFAILHDPRRYVTRVVSWQALSWSFRFASVYFFLEAFHMPATAHNALIVLIVQSISTLLPFTPGGVGTVQGLLVYIYRDEIATSTVLTFSVGMHVATVAANLLLGFTAILVMLRTLRWRRVVRPEERLAEP
ncbi:MAG: flippase-like domain-containing protein [Actinobacteria bacterium]|nr:flippase-like domain-containing protein [Actinomycetota bacterium]